jgi:hypothetical protein
VKVSSGRNVLSAMREKRNDSEATGIGAEECPGATALSESHCNRFLDLIVKIARDYRQACEEGYTHGHDASCGR